MSINPGAHSHTCTLATFMPVTLNANGGDDRRRPWLVGRWGCHVMRGLCWRCSEIANYTPHPCQCLVGEKEGRDKTRAGYRREKMEGRGRKQASITSMSALMRTITLWNNYTCSVAHNKLFWVEMILIRAGYDSQDESSEGQTQTVQHR